MENKLNSGALFKNDKKTNEKQPDYRGNGNINGKQMDVAAWVKQGKNGNFLSLSFSEPYVSPVKNEPVIANDDLPF